MPKLSPPKPKVYRPMVPFIITCLEKQNDPNEHRKKYQRKFNENTVARNKSPKLRETKHFNNFTPSVSFAT
eukprot:3856988-Amphidinium_carterae.1